VSTELRAALREAVADAPPYDIDPYAIVRVGVRRTRRRAAAVVGGCSLAAAALVVATVMSGPERSAPDPAPAEIDRLDLDDSRAVDLDVIASTRTAWDNDRDSLDYDELVGITTDGLVLRGRHTLERGEVELGLLDPRSGRTDWLPTPPGRPFEAVPLDMTAERLVLVHAAGNGHSVLVFDRAARTWRREVIRVPYGIEVHMPPRVELAPDDRVYIGSTMEGESGPIHWWSAPIAEGGQARPEPDLLGAAVAWSGDAVLRGHPDGRVVVTRPDEEIELTDRRPGGCEGPAPYPDAPLHVLWAGDRPVVTYLCDSGSKFPRSHTVVFDPEEDRRVEIADVSATAADTSHVLLAGGAPAGNADESSTYLLGLDELSLARVGRGPHEPHVALAAGLLLWNTPGPGDSQDAYDVVWNVARLE
jgi:hypothetical protein